MFKIVCAWCWKAIRENTERAPVTHLICQACYEKEMRLLQAELANAADINPAEPEQPEDQPSLKEGKGVNPCLLRCQQQGLTPFPLHHEYQPPGEPDLKRRLV